MSRIYPPPTHQVNTTSALDSNLDPLQGMSWGSQVVSPQIRKFNNLDKLIVGFFIDHSLSFFFPQLDEAKLRSRELSADVPIKIGDKEFILQAGSHKYYPYILKTGDIFILLSKRDPDGKTPNFRVEIGSMSCWANYHVTIDSLIDLMKSLGCKFVFSEVVNRVDMCCDLVGVSITELAIRNENQWITRSTNQENSFKEALHNKQLNAVTIAPKSPVRLIIYDKVNELKNNEIKQAFFARVWETKSYDKSPVVRCEFQIKRDFLDKWGLRTLEDLEKSLGGIWEYVTTKWCRHASSKVDRENKNQSHSQVSEFWKIIQDVNWGELRHIEKKEKGHPNTSVLINLMFGCGLKLAIINGANPYVADDVTSEILRIARKKMEHMLLEEPKKYTLKVRKISGEMLSGL